MPRALTDDMLDDKTPASVIIGTEARAPETDDVFKRLFRSLS